MILAFSLLLAAPEEPRALKYVFKPGDEARYVYTSKIVTGPTKGGKEAVSLATADATALIWRIVEVDSDKGAEVVQKVRRYRSSMNVRGFKDATDSTNKQNPPEVKEFFDDVHKSEVRFRMQPSGKIHDFRIPPALKDRLKREAKGFGEANLTGPTLNWLVLPEKPVAPGDSWDDLSKRDSKRPDESNQVYRVTFDGAVDHGGRKALKFRSGLEPRAGKKHAASESTSEQSVRGLFLLDAESLWPLEMSLTVTILSKEKDGENRTVIEHSLVRAETPKG